MKLAMARLAFIALVVLGLAGCSRNEEGRKFITQRCLASGQETEVCDCLARESDARLDQQMFEVVVLGARGDDQEAELAMQELDSPAKAKFAAIVPQIQKECGLLESQPGS